MFDVFLNLGFYGLIGKTFHKKGFSKHQKDRLKILIEHWFKVCYWNFLKIVKSLLLNSTFAIKIFLAIALNCSRKDWLRPLYQKNYDPFTFKEPAYVCWIWLHFAESGTTSNIRLLQNPL